MKIVKLMLLLGIALYASHDRRLETRQLLIVTAQNWSISHATLQRYHYTHGAWKRVGHPLTVQIGRNGLGWGRGLHPTPHDSHPIKHEGDGKAPAGIFQLNEAFGYAPYTIAYPYRVYRASDHCVDDIHSPYYNKIIDSTTTPKHYTSYERMRFAKDYYQYGLVVNHNGIRQGESPLKGAGSCIFIHIKPTPTAGCTAMGKQEMKQLLRWLDPHANPLLIQGVQSDIPQLLKQIIPHQK